MAQSKNVKVDINVTTNHNAAAQDGLKVKPMRRRGFWDRIKAAWRAFQGKPKTSLSIGVEVKQCRKCDREQIREMEWLDDFGAQCSECGFSCGDEYYLGAGRFCPECGARARKPLRERGAER